MKLPKYTEHVFFEFSDSVLAVVLLKQAMYEHRGHCYT